MAVGTLTALLIADGISGATSLIGQALAPSPPKLPELPKSPAQQASKTAQTKLSGVVSKKKIPSQLKNQPTVLSGAQGIADTGFSTGASLLGGGKF